MASVYYILVYIVYFTISTYVQAGILYPYGPAAGDTAAFPPEDDHCYGPHNHSVTMFGKNFSKIYVCTNGVISLDNIYKEYSTKPFPLDKSKNASLISTFWTDADLTTGGKLWIRETTDPALLQRGTDEIKRAYTSAAKSSYKATWMLIATWEDVLPFIRTGRVKPKGNTFQAVIVSHGTAYFVIFNYEKIGWIASSSGPKPAQVGFDAGDGHNYYAIPNSRTPKIINITSDSNVGIPGRCIFQLGTIGSRNILLPDMATATFSAVAIATNKSTTTTSSTTDRSDAITSRPDKDNTTIITVSIIVPFIVVIITIIVVIFTVKCMKQKQVAPAST